MPFKMTTSCSQKTGFDFLNYRTRLVNGKVERKRRHTSLRFSPQTRANKNPAPHNEKRDHLCLFECLSCYRIQPKARNRVHRIN